MGTMPESSPIMPQDAEAEQATLGCMVQNQMAIADVAEVLTADDFFEPRHRKLFTMLCEMERARTPVDIVTVRDELIRRKIDEFGTTPAQVADSIAHDILFAVPVVGNALYYAAIVRDKAQRRRIVTQADKMRARAADPTATVPELLEEASLALTAIGEERNAKYATDFLSLAQEAFDSLQNREHLTGVPTGFIELDDILSGLQPGELIVIGARPSMGKTAFGLNLILHAAMKADVPTMFFSLEMSAKSVTQRMLCMLAQVDAHLVRRGMQSAADVDKLREALELMSGPLVINDQPSPTVYQIRNGIRRNSRESKIGLVVIDYLQFMKAPRAESRQVAVAEISRELKAIARELNVPMVVLAQLNRQVEGRTENRPRMSDLRESGALEQDADVVLMLHREEYYNPKKEDLKGLAEVIVSKQRNGPTGTIQLRWNPQWTRFDNMSVDPLADETYRSYAKAQAPSNGDARSLATRLPYVEPERDTTSDVPW